jgi:hypothetical protein
MLKPLRFVTDCTGVCTDNIERQLNSNLVSGTRSPGLPFVPKFKCNADVIAEHGVSGLANLVVQQYQEGSWNHHSVNFLKMEANKADKVEAGLDRCVQSVSLVVQLIFRSFFGAMGDVAVENYRKNPVAAGWSPLKPGDAQHLYDRLKGSKKKEKSSQLFMFDGKAYEYTAHTAEAYSDVSRIFVALMQPAKGVTETTFRKHQAEALEFLDIVGKMGYQLSNGTVVEKSLAFLLNSGRWDTFLRNSITGLYWDTVTKLDCGFTKDQILRDFEVVVGGDDNVQRVPLGFDDQQYVYQMRSYGLPIHQVKKCSITDGFEFFSWDFSEDASGFVRFVPTRFTKHIENLRVCKHENRPESLRGAMMNWVHDDDKYTYFRNVFMAGHEEDPEMYRLELLVDRVEYLGYLRGTELAGSTDRYPTPVFDVLA